jgi:CheY-like chemotaxis protein
MSESLGRPVEILLVEDNPGDVRLTQEALKDGKVWNTLHHVPDGVEALAFLTNSGDYAQVPLPDLILLDLNLPRKDGREVLATIKADARLASIPVVVLTTSRAEKDVLKSYGLHANCYIVKPFDLEQFVQVVQVIESFWLCVVKLPSSVSESEGELICE